MELEKREGTGSFRVFVLSEAYKTKTTMNPIVIDNIDIVEFTFFEDIFSFTMNARLMFVDRAGVVELLPFTGHEKIFLMFGEKDEQVVEFEIFSVKNIEQFSQQEASGQSIIELILVDPYFKKLTQKRYSKSWANTKISDIIQDIAERMLSVEKFDKFEASNEIMTSFVMPYWTPGEAIRYLMERASGAESGLPGYLFYMNRKGCNFVTIDKLFQSTEIEMSDDKNPLYYKFTSGTDMNYINRILSWQISSIDNLSLLGIKGGTRLGWDFTQKRLIKKTYEYSDVVQKYTLLGRKSLYPSTIDDNTVKYVMDAEPEDGTIDNIYYHDFIRRYSKQLSVNMLLQGHERRTIGSMIDIQWPSAEKDNMLNKNMEGKYLIKSLSHQFSSKTVPTYRERAIILRNAYTESDYPGLVKAVKTNLTTNVRKIGA